MRLAAANNAVATALSRARIDLGTAEDELHTLKRAIGEVGDSAHADASLKVALESLTAIREELEVVRNQCASLNSCSSVQQIDAESARIVKEVDAVTKRTLHTLRLQANQLRGELRKAHRTSEATSFAALLRDALDAAQLMTAQNSRADQIDAVDADQTTANESIQVSQSESEAESEAVPTSRTAPLVWDDIAVTVGNAAVRYTQLMTHPESLSAESARVLVAHGSRFLDVVDCCSENASQQDLISASNLANVLLELLPGFEREARALREVLAQIAEFEAGAGAFQQTQLRATSPHAFASLDDAEDYLTHLRAAHMDAADQDYIRACIDDVMRKHGYDIARSVTLGRAVTGEHLVFGSDATADGVHVFMSDQGDMMMEVVGVTDAEAIPEDSPVSFAQTDDAEDAEHLLELQEEFCSVYAEIESELAAYGITVNTVNRCEPSIVHSKELRIQTRSADIQTKVPSEEGRVQKPAKAAASKSDSRRRRRGSAGKERML